MSEIGSEFRFLLSDIEMLKNEVFVFELRVLTYFLSQHALYRAGTVRNCGRDLFYPMLR